MEYVLVISAANDVIGSNTAVENSVVDYVVPSLVPVRGTMVEVGGATFVVAGVN